MTDASQEWDFSRCVPIRRVGQEDPTEVLWGELPLDVYQAAFYSMDAYAHLDANPNTPVAAVPLEGTIEISRHIAPLPLAFIAHMSRCGSTFVHRAIAAVQGGQSCSEPGVMGPFEPEDGVSHANQLKYSRAVLLGLAQRQKDTAQTSAIKLSHFQSEELRLWLESVPEARWIYLYRDPVEVVVSHLLRPANWLVHLPSEFGADEITNWCVSPAEALCKRLSMSMKEALFCLEQGGNGACLAYRDLSLAALPAVLSHLGVPYDKARDAQALRNLAGRHSKSDKAFTPDRSNKQSLANAQILSWVDQYCGDTLSELDGHRRRLRFTE